MERFGISLILSITIISCSSPKFYKEIKETRTEVEDYKMKSIDEGKEYCKTILENLKDELQNSSRIIYFYIPPGSQNSEQPYFAVLADLDNGKEYYIKRNNTELSIDTINNSQNAYYKFIIDNYKDRNLADLNTLGLFSSMSLPKFQDENIYEINLKTGESYFFSFISIEFHDGKPEHKL